MFKFLSVVLIVLNVSIGGFAVAACTLISPVALIFCDDPNADCVRNALALLGVGLFVAVWPALCMLALVVRTNRFGRYLKRAPYVMLGTSVMIFVLSQKIVVPGDAYLLTRYAVLYGSVGILNLLALRAESLGDSGADKRA